MRSRGCGGWALLLAVLLSGCASLSEAVRSQTAAQLNANDPARLVGRWAGEVELTFPDRTLVVHSVSRKNNAWVAQLEYGTTGLYLNSLAGVVEESDGQLTLRFVTPLASTVRLTLRSDTLLRGTFRLPTEDQDRPIELKRVARGGEPVPSTALDRAGKAAAAPPAATRSATAQPSDTAVAAAGPPLAPSVSAQFASALPALLTGRWEGDLDFTVSARLLLIDSVKREGDTWVVVARSGVSEADLTPVPVTIDTSQDKVVIRYNTSFASRATLTLHTDGVLRGVFRFAFEARPPARVSARGHRRHRTRHARADRAAGRQLPQPVRPGRRERRRPHRHRRGQLQQRHRPGRGHAQRRRGASPGRDGAPKSVVVSAGHVHGRRQHDRADRRRARRHRAPGGATVIFDPPPRPPGRRRRRRRRSRASRGR